MSSHFYADKAQSYVHTTHKNVTQAFDRLKNCLDDVKIGLFTNKLNLNRDQA